MLSLEEKSEATRLDAMEEVTNAVVAALTQDGMTNISRDEIVTAAKLTMAWMKKLPVDELSETHLKAFLSFKSKIIKITRSLPTKDSLKRFAIAYYFALSCCLGLIEWCCLQCR